MIKHSAINFIATCFLFLPVIFSCNKSESNTQKESSDVKESVQRMMENISKDVTKEGPIAWLRYFEDVPDFFMASDGLLVLNSNDSAKMFIKNVLVKQISKSELHWSGIRVDPLSLKFAIVSAVWHEDMFGFDQKKTSQHGYFTATAEKTNNCWQLRNAHWSQEMPK